MPIVKACNNCKHSISAVPVECVGCWNHEHWADLAVVDQNGERVFYNDNKPYIGIDKGQDETMNDLVRINVYSKGGSKVVTIEKGAIVAHYKRFNLLLSELEEEPSKYLYEIADLAINCSDRGRTMVVYRALYGKHMLFVRSIEEFTSYISDVGRYRFEQWED